MTTFVHEGDLPAEALAGASAVAVDSETMGLRLGRDPLCVVQLSDGKGDAHVVKLDRATYDAPNLKRLLTDPTVTKIFHFGRFDIAMFWLHLGVVTAPVYCTKIASKLARTYTDRHGLKDVTRELIGVDISKAQQSSDWGPPPSATIRSPMPPPMSSTSTPSVRASTRCWCASAATTSRAPVSNSSRTAPCSTWPAGRMPTSSPIPK